MKQQNAFFPSKNIGDLRAFLQEYYPLISVLVGYFLVAISMGPFQNGDTAWEYDAVLGVLKTGLPVANGGYLMDQPPLGFYIHALFFQVFGMSIENGTLVVTLFGLGSVALVYGIGKLLYNKTTGFFAALLFSLSPWHLILSRTFLIDVLCLFFSLLSLLLALHAFRKDSLSFFIFSGIAFAAAFNTKLYAFFMLIPLAAYFLQYHRKNIRQIIVWLAAFSIPTIIAVLLWYQLIAGIGLSSIFLHTDLTTENQTIINPTPFFAVNFLASYGLGWFFIDAITLSLIVTLLYRRTFDRFLFFEATCLAVIVCVIVVNTVLGAVLDLKAPFLNAVKYDYQALPFFSFLAASMITKSTSLIRLSFLKNRIRKVTLIGAAFLGIILVVVAVFYNMNYAHLLSSWDYLIFRVDPGVNEGYSLFNPTPIQASSPFMYVQFFGFALAISGMLWVSRHKLASLRKFVMR